MKYYKFFKDQLNFLEMINLSLALILILSLVNIVTDINLLSLNSFIWIVIPMTVIFNKTQFSIYYTKLVKARLFQLTLVKSFILSLAFIICFFILYILNQFDFFMYHIEVFKGFSFVDLLLFYILAGVNFMFVIDYIVAFVFYNKSSEVFKLFMLAMLFITLFVILPLAMYITYIFENISQMSKETLNMISFINHTHWISILVLLLSCMIWYVLIKLSDRFGLGMHEV